MLPPNPAEQGSSAEEWRVIPGSEGYYSVSNLGRVRSEPLAVRTTGRQRGGILQPCPDTKGYLQFAMCLPGRGTLRMKVHRAVALAFLGPRPDGAQINHISGDKMDNRVWNLEYVSCRQNVRHSWAVGLRTAEQVCGERHGMAKLTATQVREIRSAHGVPHRTLALQHGVTPQCISDIVKGRTWRRVA